MGKVLSKEDIEKHNSMKYRYIRDHRSNYNHYAHLNISHDEQTLTKEDSAYGDTLSIGGNPELVWELADKNRDLLERGFSPEEHHGMTIKSDDFPMIPLGYAVPVYDTGAVIFENGVVVSRTGKVAAAFGREARKHYGATSLTQDGDVKNTQYQVKLAGNKQYRIAALMLELHGGMPQPSKNHKIWFRDGNFANCTLENLRWVKKQNLKKLVKG